MVALAQALPQDYAADLSIESVSHVFALQGQSLPVLDDVSLQVEAGAFVALLGPSGCGKSTLLRLLAGLEKPTAGRVLVDGATVVGPHPSRTLMFQDPTLYPWRTVRANAELGPQARGQSARSAQRVDAALSLVGLSEFATAYPHQLSGGMAQRAALARALVNEPSLLLLDEPLGKLDSLTRLTMQKELVRLWQTGDFTAILVTHDVEEALLMATRIVVFSDRPARIKAEFEVDRPYPRHRDDPELIRLRGEILHILGIEGP